MQKNFLIITGIIFILEFYVYQAFKTVTNNQLLRIGYWVITLSVYAFFVYELLNFSRSDRDHHRVQIVASILLEERLFSETTLFTLIIMDLLHRKKDSSCISIIKELSDPSIRRTQFSV